MLLGLLWIMQLKPPLIRTLNAIFYSCAIAYSVQWISIILYMTFLSAQLWDVGITIFYYIYLLPLAYLQYVGLKDLLKSKHFLILTAVVIAVVVHYLLFEPELLLLRGVLDSIF